MEGDGPAPTPGTAITRIASLMIIFAGLYFGRGLVIPILVAAFLAILCYKPMELLVRKGLPTWAALVIVLVVALLVIGGFGLVVGNAIADFAAVVPKYQDEFESLADRVATWLDARGIEIDFLEQTNPETGEAQPGISDATSKKLLSMVTALLKETLSLLSDFALIVLIMAFMLAEAAQMPTKLRVAFDHAEDDLRKGRKVMDQVYSYVSIKTAISVITGVLFGLATWIIGLDFPVLWGLLAFALNFVPNIGSVLALVPPAVFALVTNPGDPMPAVWVVVANLLVNQVMGNIVEPKVMGSRLGLSPLVVILSLVFWAWLWGPIGMILSVPLTMVVKIVMEGSETWRPVAILLGPADAGSTESGSGTA